MRSRFQTVRPALAVLTAALLASCQFADETLWPENPPPGIQPRTPPPADTSELAPTTTPTEGEEPLMVIRSDREDIAFQTPLSQTVEQVLRLRPEARFDLVAVRPGQGTTQDQDRAGQRTQRQAEEVLRYLAGNLGLAPDRLSLSAITNPEAQAGEVRIYLR